MSVLNDKKSMYQNITKKFEEVSQVFVSSSLNFSLLLPFELLLSRCLYFRVYLLKKLWDFFLASVIFFSFEGFSFEAYSLV